MYNRYSHQTKHNSSRHNRRIRPTHQNSRKRIKCPINCTISHKAVIATPKSPSFVFTQSHHSPIYQHISSENTALLAIKMSNQTNQLSHRLYQHPRYCFTVTESQHRTRSFAARQSILQHILKRTSGPWSIILYSDLPPQYLYYLLWLIPHSLSSATQMYRPFETGENASNNECLVSTL